MTKPNIELKDSEKSKPVRVFTKKVRGKWIISETPIPGGTVEWYASKVKPRAYYQSKKEAEERAEKYNKKRASQLKGKAVGKNKGFDNVIKWDWFAGTQLHEETIWWHQRTEPIGPWLYEHGWMGDWDYWFADELLKENMGYRYEDDHNNFDFFDLLFKIKGYTHLYLKEENGEWKIFSER